MEKALCSVAKVVGLLVYALVCLLISGLIVRAGLGVGLLNPDAFTIWIIAFCLIFGGGLSCW